MKPNINQYRYMLGNGRELDRIGRMEKSIYKELTKDIKYLLPHYGTPDEHGQFVKIPIVPIEFRNPFTGEIARYVVNKVRTERYSNDVWVETETGEKTLFASIPIERASMISANFWLAIDNQIEDERILNA